MIDSNSLGRDLSEKPGPVFRISLWMAQLAPPFLAVPSVGFTRSAAGTTLKWQGNVERHSADFSDVYDAQQLLEMSADSNKGAPDLAHVVVDLNDNTGPRTFYGRDASRSPRYA